jgi:uncharacterized repeat protein (TIGR01451 family)
MSRGKAGRRRGSLLGPIVMAMLAVGQASTMIARASPPAAAMPGPLEPDVTIATANEPEGAVLNGDSITYTIAIANRGDATAKGVEVSDQLPANVTFAGATRGCSEAAGLVTCALGEIEAQTSLRVDINVTVNEAFCGAIVNAAEVSTSNEGVEALSDDDSNDVSNTVECVEPTRPSPGEPTAEPALEVPTPPDLQVSKSSDAGGILHDGDDFLYTITLTNVGGGEARGVRLVDVLPPGALNVGVPPFPTFTGGACTVTSSVPPGGGTPNAEVRCGPVPLGPGESASVTIKVIVSGDVCGTIVNVVDVGSSNEPPENVGPDNHAEASDEIACVPRIRLLKGGPSLAHVGDTIRYLFRARNNGNVDLFDVELADTTCDASPVLHHDPGGDKVLAAGEEWMFACAHTITVGDGDPVNSRATVSGDHEGGTVKDSDIHQVNVIHPGIDLETTASPTSGPAGTPITYTYAVTNTGDTTLFHISVDDERLGRVGEIAALRDGQTVELTRETTLGSSPITNVSTAAGSDVIGAPVSDVDDATVFALSAPGSAHGGTPFTGSDTGALAGWIVILTALGAALLAPSRRRSDAHR